MILRTTFRASLQDIGPIKLQNQQCQSQQKIQAPGMGLSAADLEAICPQLTVFHADRAQDSGRWGEVDSIYINDACAWAQLDWWTVFPSCWIWPYYLPRELTSVFVAAVYIPPVIPIVQVFLWVQEICKSQLCNGYTSVSLCGTHFLCRTK